MAKDNPHAAPAPAAAGLALLEGKDVELAGPDAFKPWLAPIGGARFLVLEHKFVVTEDSGLAPQHWLVYAVTIKGVDALELRRVDADFAGLGYAKSSAEAEAIIARGLGNPELFDASATMALTRVPTAH